jgi:hypothetical protein
MQTFSRGNYHLRGHIGGAAAVVRPKNIVDVIIRSKHMHTKGPWEARISKYEWLVVSEDCLICTAEKEQHTLPETRARQDADARLIAAAPEMLEALISVQRYIEGEPWDDTDISAIIKKACPSWRKEEEQ